MANIFVPFSSGLILGTPADDTITLLAGTSTASLVGLGGNDVIKSLLGNATLYGDYKDNITLNFPSLSATSETDYDLTPTPLFGNDTLTSVLGDNKMYGDVVNFAINVTGTNNLAAGVSAPVVVTNLNVTFGNDTFTSLLGNATMFGDLDTFSISVLAGSGGAAGSEATARIGVLGVTPGLTVLFGNDTFYTGCGNDTIYGDAREYDVTLISGSNSVGATARARLDAGTTTFGDDKVFAGNGSNHIYGDVQNFNMNFTTGNNGSNNRAQDTTLYSFGNDEIHAGCGNNWVYGDAQNVIWNFIVGSGLDGTGDNNGLGFARWSGDTMQFGNDKITVGDGNNHIYGDIQNWAYSGSGAQGTIGAFSLAIMAIGGASSNDIITGNDLISAGNGNNWIYGDADTVLFTTVTPNNISQLGTIEAGLGDGSLLFGSDTMSAGNGSNVVYGDVNVLTEIYTGGDNSTSGSQSIAFRVDFDLTFGNDTITVGSGGNTVYGDVAAHTIELKAGDNGQGGLNLGINSFGADYVMNSAADLYGTKTTFGNDKIFSGSGSDILVGDAGTFALDMKGGQHWDGSGGPIYSEAGSIRLFNIDTPNNSPITFGNDEIHGGGGSDKIYGEGLAFNISAIGGSIDAPYLGSPIITNPNNGGNIVDPSLVNLDVAAGLGVNAPVTAGDDKLYGDAGNDLIYGDWKDMSITLKDGTAVGVSTIPVYTQASIDTIHLGNNILVGGDGNDTLIGGIGAINFKHLDASGHLITSNILDPNSNVAHFISGNNTIFGGQGNDVITGGSVGLTGNFGQDTFVYDGCLNNGKDTITDFHKALDALVGQNGATFHDGGHNGSGDLVIKVWDAAGHNSSTITLAGVHDSFSAILPDIQYVASPIV